MANDKRFIAKNGYALGDSTAIPTTAPSHNWNFKNSQALDPNFELTRSTTGVYYDAKTTHQSNVNKYQYSENFLNGYWDKVGCTVTANTVTDPLGTTLADTITASSGGSYHNINRDSNLEDTQVVSIFAKAGTADYIIIGPTVTQHVSFNLNTGAIGTTTGSDVAGVMTDVGNGWYRCEVNYTGTGNVIQFYMFVSDADATISYSAAGTETIHVWGAQLEWLRSSATAYVPTTSTTQNNFGPTLLTASIGKPRFDHNPRTREPLGFKIEAQATNNVTRSNPATGWSYTNVIQWETIAPDGEQTACVFAPDATSAQHFISTTLPVTTGQKQCKSLYVKNYGLNEVEVHLSTAVYTSGSVNFNFTTETMTKVGDVDDYGFQDVGDGWYRLFLTATTDATGNDTFYIGVPDLDSFTGTGVNGVAVWGVQQEVGNKVTSLVTTTGATATRNAEIVYMEKGPLTLPGDYTIYMETDTEAPTNVDERQSYITVYYTSSDWHDVGPNSYGGTGLLNSFMYYNGGGVITTSTALQTSNVQGIALDGNAFKIAFKFGDNDFRMLATGTSATTDTGYDRWDIPESRLYLGSRYGSSQVMTGHLKQVQIYPTLLSNANLSYLVED